MKKIGISIVIGLLILGVSSPVQAHEQLGGPSSRWREEVESRVKERMQLTRDEVNEVREEVRSKRVEIKQRFTSQKEAIEQRRTELKQHIEAKRSERKAKLADKRLQLCTKRQAKINELVTRSVRISTDRLARVQQIEDSVRDFYTSHSLESAEYEAAIELVEEKEANAIAAIDVTKANEFACTKVDAKDPAGEIKMLHKTKVQALNEYRDHVKQLVQIVKAAYIAKVDDQGAST